MKVTLVSEVEATSSHFDRELSYLTYFFSAFKIVLLLFPVLAKVVARLNDNNNDDNSTAVIESRLEDVHDDETLALANVSNTDDLDEMLLSKADTAEPQLFRKHGLSLGPYPGLVPSTTTRL